MTFAHLGGRADEVLSSFPPYYQAARTHDRTETEIDFPVGLTPPTSDIYIYICTYMLYLIEIDLTQIGNSDEQSTSAKRSEVDKRLNKVHLQRNAHFWQAPDDFEQGRQS